MDDLNDRDPWDPDGKTPLIHTAWAGYEGIVKFFLKNAASTDSQDKLGRTAMMYAASAGNEAVVRRLLEACKKNSLNHQDLTGTTPLTFAALTGNKAVVKLTLENLADSNARDIGNRTALLYAEYCGYQSAVELLCTHVGLRPPRPEGFPLQPRSLRGVVSIRYLDCQPDREDPTTTRDTT
ncbi:MAG: hypothetical protein Q9172_005882 [Xanthocarpia lactea]